jgi:mono/diheme cytochrome c family protein
MRSSARTTVAVLAMWLAFGVMPALADDADIGREIYGEFCLNCHGRDMINTGGVSADLRKFPKNDFDRFRRAILDGKGQAMPGWRGKLGDDDLNLLWAYVRSGG